jgi:dienelactone hydrolase
MPWSFVALLETKLKGPLPWLETIFYKPFYALQVASIALPFLFHCRRSVCAARIFTFFTALRVSAPPFPTASLKVGAAGFCWGGLYAILLTADEPRARVTTPASPAAPVPLIECAFTAHPSLVKFPGDVEGVSRPLSVAIGNEDMYMKGPVIVQMKEMLEGMGRGHEVVVLEGARHGFAQRTDPEDKLQMEYAEKAEAQAIEWFGRWFA